MVNETIVDCPRCGEAVHIRRSKHVYGSDADGNRGVPRTDCRISQKCSCDLSKDQLDELIADAGLDDGPNPDEAYDSWVDSLG